MIWAVHLTLKGRYKGQGHRAKSNNHVCFITLSAALRNAMEIYNSDSDGSFLDVSATPSPPTPPAPSPPSSPSTSSSPEPLHFLTGAKGGKQASYNGYLYCGNGKKTREKEYCTGPVRRGNNTLPPVLDAWPPRLQRKS